LSIINPQIGKMGISRLITVLLSRNNSKKGKLSKFAAQEKLGFFQYFPNFS